MRTSRDKRIVVDGVLVDDLRFTRGYWDAEDVANDLAEAPKYIVPMIGKRISVSLETVVIVEGLLASEDRESSASTPFSLDRSQGVQTAPVDR